eukprot:CAMPEP_0198200416 /NCGR_PEP_ID=MMETSP1445-20131203/3428_1 /TAXON_ID=36898 /ORGANISM="Pyramimonas sp., Strain CCMP2087" /LENGTH=137 /DNA_ID=CAMNT_0043870473 /DNA_START=176 /DNA_END=589 /DNA_ORIENTATION=+
MSGPWKPLALLLVLCCVLVVSIGARVTPSLQQPDDAQLERISHHGRSGRTLLTTKDLAKEQDKKHQYPTFVGSKLRWGLEKPKKKGKEFEEAQKKAILNDARHKQRINLRHTGEAVRKEHIKPRPKSETGMHHPGWK